MIYYQYKAILALQDGTQYKGYNFGATVSSTGETVSNISMTGYIESLTDPSYRGQILIYSFPLLGNNGIPKEDFSKISFYESEKIHVNGLIISDYTNSPNHWRMTDNLSFWLKKNNIPGIYGLDTKAIIKKLRKKGSLLGNIMICQNISYYTSNKENLASTVCIKKKKKYGNGKYNILLLDFGVKNNILRFLLKRNCTIVRVPWNYDFRFINCNGLIISNGPGNPKGYKRFIIYLRYCFKKQNPIFGICLGNQLLGLAAGSETFKLISGHRSQNQSVLLEGSIHPYVTSQNHDYIIEKKSLFKNWIFFFKNLNDSSCEGLIHKINPFFSTQFHPEGSGGPIDTEFLFDWFIQRIKINKF